MNDAPGMATEQGKELYRVVPKQDTDAAATTQFIKSTVGNNDVHPLSNVRGRLMWTVEASPSQVAQLEDHEGIALVTKLKSRKEEDPLHRKFTIYPVDGQNLDQCNATDASLRAILDDMVKEPRMWDSTFRNWVALLTNAQVEQVKAINGVKAVRPVHKGRRGVVRGLRKPSSSPKASSPLEKRDIIYETEEEAAPELVAASQQSATPVSQDL
ncbi:hypothetical protein Neosp_003339 [[Neocosmospora] mangrovei]